MGLNVGSSGGDFLPAIKFNAKDGQWFIRQDDDWAGLDDFKAAVFDLENITTGYLGWGGNGPDFRPDPSITEVGPAPEGEYKRAFKVNLYSKKAGGVREMMCDSKIVGTSMRELYAEFEEAAKSEEAQGKVPVLKIAGTNKISIPNGTFYTPNWSVDKWIDRPEELPSANGASAAPPPAAPDDEEEF